MANSKKRPGENTGNQGGIFQEMGAKGGLKPNFATVADNKQAQKFLGASKNHT